MVFIETKLFRGDTWYINGKECLCLGGREIVKIHDDSHVKAVLSAFPGHNWDISQFTQVWKNSKVPKGYINMMISNAIDFWRDWENVKFSFEWASHQLGIYQLKDWFKVKGT